MKQTTPHRSLTRAVTEAAPNLKYIGFYRADEKRLLSCMQDYENRSFVYLLTADFKESEIALYAGKSTFQYARILSHSKHFSFDYLYLFECNKSDLKECERKVISALKPVYNCSHNPLAARYSSLLNLNYQTTHTEQETQHHLHTLMRYQTFGLFGISLPAPIYLALKQIAEAEQSTVSRLIQQTFEEQFPAEIFNAANNTDLPMQTCNLLTTAEYAEHAGRDSVEWVKKLLQEGRITGAKLGRDWVIAEDTCLPPDKRKNEWTPIDL